jgi:hypothetical protein
MAKAPTVDPKPAPGVPRPPATPPKPRPPRRPLVARAKTNVVPWPMRRLQEIKPNQRIVFYRGAVHAGDIAPGAGTPTYATLMERIFDTARGLEAQGKLQRLPRPASSTKPYPYSSRISLPPSGL